jgi:PAS domain S-box-containing protein
MRSLRSNWASDTALAAGVIVSLLGVSVLVAWQLHLLVLLQVLPVLAPMHRMTALGTAMCGVAMVFAALGYKRASALSALVPLSLAVLVLSEYLLNTDFGIDQLLGPDYVRVRTSSPGRMSPASAVCQIMYSLAVLALSSKRLARWASAIAGVIGSGLATVGFISVWALSLLHSEAFAWGGLTRLSIPSSISYALLGGGLLALAVQERRGRVSGWAPAAVGISAAAGVLGVWQAIVEHNEGDWELISNVIMAGGLLMALLLGVAVYQTQRARSRNEALRQSEEQFREIFQESPIGIVLVGRDFRMVSVNSAYCRMLGYSEKQLAALTPMDLTHPDDQELTRKALGEFFKTGSLLQRLEKRYVKSNGEIMWGAITNSAIHDTHGKPLYSIAMVEDITERKRAEDELRTLTQRLSLATRSASAGVWEWDLSTNISIWDDMMFQIFAMPKRAGVARQEWVRLIHREDKAKVKAFSVAIFQDKAQDEVEFRIFRPDGSMRYVSALGGPILDDHGAVTGMVGIAIDITERKQEEERLRALSTRFAQASQFASITVWEWDPRTRAYAWDDAFAVTGIPKSDLVPLETWAQRIHPDDRAANEAALNRVVQRKTQESLEVRFYGSDGTLRHLYAAGGPVLDRKGEVVRVVGISIDITKRKQEEERLRALSTRFAQVTQFASMAIWEWDPRAQVFLWDDTAFAMTGIPKADFVPYQTWLQALHPDDRAEAEGRLERIVRSKTQESVEFRVIWPDGTVRHLYAAGGAVLDDSSGEVIRVVGIAIDITERKQEEERLRALSTRFAQVTQFASMAIWEWDPHAQVFLWDDTAFAITGIPRADSVSFETWDQSIHPEDRAANAATLDRIVRGKTQESLEFRFYRRDGALRHLYAAGGPVLDSNGEVVRVVGIAIDITERKQEEERLRALSFRFAQATRFASMAVWEWDPRTRTHVWDDSGYAMAGIAKREFLPHEKWEQTVHPDDRAGANAALERIVRSKTQESMEFRVLRPDLTIRHIFAAGGPVLDSRGEVVRVIGIASDITERRRLEADLETTREQAAASARLSALGMMAGGVAHEINNPLSIIHAMASDLAEMVATDGSVPPEVVSRKSTVIRETAERIAKIVKSLRQISREGSSDTFHPTSVAKILAETLHICRAKFAANGVELLLPGTIPELSVPCREVQIAQVLLNLLQNAFDAALEREGDRWVRVDVVPRDGTVVISVVDSGPGIPLELRARVMEPFFTTKPVGKGTGLGLSLSKTIAEDHGGSLEFGEDGGGHTRFSLVLPRARKAEAA